MSGTQDVEQIELLISSRNLQSIRKLICEHSAQKLLHFGYSFRSQRFPFIVHLVSNFQRRIIPAGVEGFVRVLGLNVAVERTRCNLGGSRAWFLCPTCNRRWIGLLEPTKFLAASDDRHKTFPVVPKSASMAYPVFVQTRRTQKCPNSLQPPTSRLIAPIPSSSASS